MRRVARGINVLARGGRQSRRAIFSAIVATPPVSRTLRLRGYRSTRAWLEGRPRPRLGTPVPTEALRHADSAIRSLPWSISCLERSLVVWWLAGGEAEIRLGVAPGTDGEDHRFHAWVELDGRVLNDEEQVKSAYLPLSVEALETNPATELRSTFDS